MKKSIINQRVVDVTIIINIWKREHIHEQLSSLGSQTVLPKQIWIFQYENHVDIQDILVEFRSNFNSIVYMKSEKNLIFFGRHSLAINVDTKFTWILDDDVIPGSKWLENCVERCDKLNSIITCTGRIIPKNNFQPENIEEIQSFNHFIGDVLTHDTMNYYPLETTVDYGCNSYFYKTEWTKAFWSIWPVTFATGDDIHLSAALKSLINVDTTVLKQIDRESSGNLKKAYGKDDIATWKRSDFVLRREDVFKYHILEHKWIPILWR